MANSYATAANAFTQIIDGSYTSSDYPQMDTHLAVASRLIDKELGKWDGFFYPSSDAVTLYFDGSGERVQYIGHFVSLSNVYVAEQGQIAASSDYTEWTSGTEFFARPYNASALSLAITSLEIAANGTKYNFPAYQRAIKIVGVAGYSATPPALIAQACIIQSIRWFMRAKQAFQDQSLSVEIGGIVVKANTDLDPDVKAMLYPYKLEFSE